MNGSATSTLTAAAVVFGCLLLVASMSLDKRRAASRAASPLLQP